MFKVSKLEKDGGLDFTMRGGGGGHEANGKETVHGMVPWQHTAHGRGNHGMCGYHPHIESPSKPKRDAVFFGKLKGTKTKI